LSSIPDTSLKKTVQETKRSSVPTKRRGRNNFPICHLIFRPSPNRDRGRALPDLQTQNPQNRSTFPPGLCFQIEQI